MCLILIQPEGHVLSEEELMDFWAHSSDGFGFMWHTPGVGRTGKGQEGGVRAVKGVLGFEEMLKAYDKYAAGKAGVLHFRMATHGAVNLEMAHPFEFPASSSKRPADLLMVHNGVISGYGSTQYRKGASDTAAFMQEVLIPLLGEGKEAADALQHPEMQKHILDLVGASNSLVFLDYKGRVTKIGREGLMHDGCWYSNTYAWTPPWEFEEWRPDATDLTNAYEVDTDEYLDWLQGKK